MSFRAFRPVSILLLFTLACLTSPTAAQTCSQSAGTSQRASYRSQIADTTMYYTVYRPPCYDTQTQSYPIVYLMHGSNEDDGHWTRLGLITALDEGIRNGTLVPMLVAMPFGEWIANQNQFDAVSWENVFLNEFLPLIESGYRVNTAQRAIGGISRGGFWAYEIAFRHPELFRAVGGHSAFFDPNHAPDAYNPLDLATHAPNLEPLALWLDRGKDDFAQKNLDLMNARLSERGLNVQYHIYPEGQHANSYWKQHVSEYLAFYAAHLSAAVPQPTPTTAPLIFATNTPHAPEATPAPTTASDTWSVFVPTVVFPSLLGSLPFADLVNLRNGIADPRLLLDASTAAALSRFGVALPVGTSIVPDDALYNTLYKDRKLYTLLGFDRLSTHYRMLDLTDPPTPAADGRTLLLPIDLLSVYPFAFPDANQPNFIPAHLTRLLYSGVTALTRLTRDALDSNGVAWASEAIAPYTRAADFFHTSNEVSFSPSCPQADAPTLGIFCAKQPHFDLFPLIGLDIVELTGNHNNDFGLEADQKTLDWYAAQGIHTIGGGTNLETARQPLTLTHNGNRVALVACNAAGPYYALAGDDSPGAAPCDWDWLRATLPTLHTTYDLVILSVQYVEVEDYQPLPAQVSDFRGWADLDADVVLGTQAHKPQTFAFYATQTGEEAFIHYGLGNLFFDQPFWGQ